MQYFLEMAGASQTQKRPQRPLDDDMLSLRSTGRAGSQDAATGDDFLGKPKRLEVNSQVSSVVKLDDESNAESISFHPDVLGRSESKPTIRQVLKNNSSVQSLNLMSRGEDESTILLQKKVASLRAMEVQNMELKNQVMQTKRILTRLEEQMATQHETQLNQMFLMQQNNVDLQNQMMKLQAENEYLKTFMSGSECSVSSASKQRETFGSKPAATAYQYQTKRPIALQPPTRQIQLKSRKTIGAQAISASQTESELEDEAVPLERAMSSAKKTDKQDFKGRQTSYMTPRSSMNQCQRFGTSIGPVSQSHPYEMAPSSNGDGSPRQPFKKTSLGYSHGKKGEQLFSEQMRRDQPSSNPKADVFKVVRARQNLLYIQKENVQLKTGGHANESLSDRDVVIKQHHLEIPALQIFFERTASRMQEMNVAGRNDKHTIAVLRQRLEQLKQFRIAEQELEDCEARINSLIMSPQDPGLLEQDEITEADHSSEAGSIGDEEDVAINSGVLRRETSPAGYNGRSQSPTAINSQKTFFERSQSIPSLMFSAQQRKVPVPSTPRQTEPIAQEDSPYVHEEVIPLRSQIFSQLKGRIQPGSHDFTAETYASSQHESGTAGPHQCLSYSELRAGERDSVLQLGSPILIKKKLDQDENCCVKLRSPIPEPVQPDWHEQSPIRSKKTLQTFFGRPSVGAPPQNQVFERSPGRMMRRMNRN